MARKILITYFTEAGSTKKAAEIIGEAVSRGDGPAVDILSCDEAIRLGEYNLVFIGTPNWYGKPAPPVSSFLKEHKSALAGIRTALFYTCMSLSDVEGETLGRPKVYMDEGLDCVVKKENDMNGWEKSHAVSYYLSSLESLVPGISLDDLAFFKGDLDLRRLSFGHSLVMRFITWINKDVREGRYLSKRALQEWASTVAS